MNRNNKSQPAPTAVERRGEYVLYVYNELDSTNTKLKQLALEGAAQGTIVQAQFQSAGKGSRGRSFYSPAGTGLYFSVLLKTNTPTDGAAVTTAAAVAARTAIEELLRISCDIKWVNDLYYQNKKVCGILTESMVQNPSNQNIIAGIGINLSPPDIIPSELTSKMGYLLECAPEGALQRSLIFRTAEILLDFWGKFPNFPHLEEYRRHSLLTGRRVTFRTSETAALQEGVVIGVDDQCGLEIKLSDGTVRILRWGTVEVLSDFSI